MRLDRLTITGADDSVKPGQLSALSGFYPFVEWGILLSRSSEGRHRFPSREWLGKLYAMKQDVPSLKLSGHVCGRWVREMLDGSRMLVDDLGTLLGMFDRLQWNFHAEQNRMKAFEMSALLKTFKQSHIFQLDGVNDSIYAMMADLGVDVSPLFDTSGGAGLVPTTWPKAERGVYNGYAGGLGPDTLLAELPKIKEAARGERIWIDMERRVRSEDDSAFDISKVEECLEIAEFFMPANV